VAENQLLRSTHAFSRGRRRAVVLAAVVTVSAAVLVGCKEKAVALPLPPAPPTTTQTTTTTTEPTTTTKPPVTTTTPPNPTSPTPTTTTTTSRSAPAPSGFPSPANTGVPPGSDLTVINGDYYAKTPGQVIDLKHVTGSIVVEADGVVIKRSQIDDSVNNDSGGSFTITDSTVGPAKCGTHTWTPNGVGVSRYTAVRVHVRGHEDGFRASGPNVTVRDSYYKACAASSEAHADGIQDYPAAQRLVLDHNTFDMSHLTSGFTAPIFVYSDSTQNVTITDNLVAGGVYSLLLKPRNGSWVVTGNRAVDKEFAYGSFETDGNCGHTPLTWSDNDVVTIDANYQITGTVKNDVPCPR